MKRTIVACFLISTFFTGAACASAQQKPAAGKSETKTAEPQATDTEKTNVQEYIELLRTNVRQQKAQIMGAMMALSAADAAKFWPIYSEYDAALAKVNDQRVANIKEYADNYQNLTPEKADELIHKSMEFQKERGELLAQYYGRMKDAVGAVTAARFVQVEHQLLLIIDLQITSSLPLAQEGS